MPAPRASGRASTCATPGPAAPGLLLAAHPGAAPAWDRVVVPRDGLVLGRDPSCGAALADRHLSRRHARFYREDDAWYVEDLGSDNGTFVNGVRLAPGGRAPLGEGTVVRCGRCLLVGVADMGLWREAVPQAPGASESGRFYGPRVLAALQECLAFRVGVGLLGPAGSGKAWAMDGVAQLRQRGGSPLRTPKRLGPEDLAREAWASAAAEAPGKTDVGPRSAAAWLRSQGDRVVALRDAQRLPPRAQQRLARALRGISPGPGVPTLVLGVEAPEGHGGVAGEPPRLAAEQGARLARAAGIAAPLAEAVGWVRLPPLCERRADVPDLLRRCLRDAAAWFGLEAAALLRAVRTPHLEALCLVDFAGRNQRLLAAIAESFAAAVASGAAAAPSTLGRLLADAFPENPVVMRSRQR